jgi:hypothetical protein
VNVSSRDKKILLSVIPLALIVGYWFLVLGPKRADASKASDSLAKQERRLDDARANLAAAESSKNTFASDYSGLVKLGKAVPTKLDMPTIIVQLEAAAHGTGISFTKIAPGEREPAAGGGSTAQPPAAPGGSSEPAAAGGAPAQSGPGRAAESAGNSVNGANATSAAAEKSGASGSEAQASTAAKGGSGAPSALDGVPLNLEFRGSFFRLTDFFHSLKRFVHVANQRIQVRGRLLTVESLSFKSDAENFPSLTAELKATVYLAPANQGTTAGATPQGPAGSAAAAATTPGGASPSSTPTATATP